MFDCEVRDEFGRLWKSISREDYMKLHSTNFRETHKVITMNMTDHGEMLYYKHEL